MTLFVIAFLENIFAFLELLLEHVRQVNYFRETKKRRIVNKLSKPKLLRMVFLVPDFCCDQQGWHLQTATQFLTRFHVRLEVC